MADNPGMQQVYPALSRHGIPFEIINTDLLVRHLMRIAAAQPFLGEYLGTPPEVRWVHKAKVRVITYHQRQSSTPRSEQSLAEEAV